MRKLAFILFAITTTFSYSQISIKGNIKDETGSPVGYATAALILAKDSSLVRGSLTNEVGNYVIENIKSGNYRILASFIGCNIFEV